MIIVHWTIIIGKKKEKEQGLDNEHKHKLKPVIKHFDIRILWNFKFSLAVVKRKDSEWVLILIIQYLEMFTMFTEKEQGISKSISTL